MVKWGKRYLRLLAVVLAIAVVASLSQLSAGRYTPEHICYDGKCAERWFGSHLHSMGQPSLWERSKHDCWVHDGLEAVWVCP